MNDLNELKYRKFDTDEGKEVFLERQREAIVVHSDVDVDVEERP